MIIHHQFIEDKNLLIQKATGEWSTEYYLKYVDSVFMHKKMANVQKILSDLRGINLEKAFKDVDLLIELREKMVKLDYLSVVLVSSPSSTAVTHLYQDKVTSKGFDHTYCGTMKKALSLLSIDIREKEMEALFKEIENQS